MPVADRADSVDVRAVRGADARVLRWECLKIPVGRPVGSFEGFARQEGKGGAVETGCEDDNVGINVDCLAWAAFWNALGALVEAEAVLGEGEDVATEPLGVTRADQIEDVRVDHGRSLKDALIGRGQVCEVTVEEFAEQEFGNEAEEGLLAENVERGEH